MRKSYILFIGLLLGMAHGVHAQDSKPEKKSELEKTLEKGRRKVTNKIEDENPVFTVQTAPEKWKNESAVILLDYVKIQRVMESGSNPKGEASREYHLKRILIQDHFAVNDFSEFELSSTSLLEITVVKPNGNKIVLDKSKAVSAEVRVEDIIIPYFNFRYKTTSKIPVPGLEPGDIIEIEEYFENIYENPYGGISRGSWRDYYGIRRLNQSYPVYYKIMDFELDRGVQLNWKSMHGAPDLIAQKGKKDTYFYTFIDSLRGRNKAEFWSPGTVDLPFVKFALLKKKSSGTITEFGVPQKGEVLKKAEELQIKKLVHNLHNNSEKFTHSGIMRRFTLKYRDEDMDPETYVSRFYEFYRSYYYFQVADDLDDDLSNIRFILIMKRILEKKNLEYDYIVAIPRRLGNLDDIISVNEVELGLRVRETGQILQMFNVYSVMGEVSSGLKGTEAYIVEPAKSLGKMRVDRELLPQTPKEENNYYFEVKAKLLPGFEQIEVENTAKLKGSARYAYMEDMPYTLFEKDFNAIYGNEYLQSSTFRVWYQDMEGEDFKDEKMRRDTTLNYELNRSAIKKLKRSHSNKYYQIKDYTYFELLETGRTVDDPELSFRESYVVEGLCGNAGAHYIVDLGRLLGQQMEIIDSEDSIRTQSIYFGYPRVISYKLRFEIPAGMQVAGLDAFNVNVDNATGSYTMKAQQEGNIIVVEASKTYKQVLIGKDGWNDVKAFVDAASELNSKRIILTR